MFLRFTILLLFLFAYCNYLHSQACSTLGQTPATAFPVCGTTVFEQVTVPICTNKDIPVFGCENSNASYADKNPYWYRFTCFKSGTLGFLITPKDLGDDYDWQLFDITDHDPNDVYTDRSLFVVANWSGSYGITGTSANTANSTQCASDPTDHETTYSKMPELQEGHTYLLLVSHFTDSQSGYSLSFAGGSASITDPKMPDVLGAQGNCDGTKVMVKLNKRMKCSSLATNGSDFKLLNYNSSIIAASAISCNTGFDMDSIVLTFEKPLPPGEYTLVTQKGRDYNTLLDYCDRAVPENASIPFTVFPVVPTPMDSIAPVACSPKSVDLVFKKPMRCNSIATNGSDFKVTGPYPVNIVSAKGNCDADGLSSVITVTFSAPVTREGTYHVQLVNGLDGNTVIDECGQETLASSVVDFFVKDTVSAKFASKILYGCDKDTIICHHDGKNSVNKWLWSFDNGITRNTQNADIVYHSYGDKKIGLVVSNGFCTDTFSTVVTLDNELRSAFEAPNILCPEDKAVFKNNSIGKIVKWSWSFGDGITGYGEKPAEHKYALPERDKIYTVQLVTEDQWGCSDTSYQKLTVLNNCYIAVPTAFTPNGDGLNDYLFPLNAYKAVDLTFKVFNRYGQLLFNTTDWTNKWDGTFKGIAQESGTYVWMLNYTLSDTGKKYTLKGTTVLIR